MMLSLSRLRHFFLVDETAGYLSPLFSFFNLSLNVSNCGEDISAAGAF